MSRKYTGPTRHSFDERADFVKTNTPIEYEKAETSRSLKDRQHGVAILEALKQYFTDSPLTEEQTTILRNSGMPGLQLATIP